MNKILIYSLSGCDKCRRILKDFPKENIFVRCIKKQPLTDFEVDILKKMTGSYEALFSRQSVRYKKLKESEKPKSEREFREWLINDYTSLKRPVFVFDNEISINDVSKALSWL